MKTKSPLPKMKLATLLVIMPAMGTALRTLGEIAHPGARYDLLLASVRAIKAPEERARYIVESGLTGSATVGFLAASEKRSARFMKMGRVIEALMYNPDNIDRPGRDLGVGYLPHVSYANVLQALVANSDLLTPRDMFNAVDEARAAPSGGAWLYAPVLPRFKTIEQKTLPISAHIDNYFIPENGSDPWWMTSLVTPTATGRPEIVALLKAAGYDSFNPSPASSSIEKLCAGQPPDPEIGNWNFIMTGGFDDFGKSVTSGRLFAAMLGTEQMPYEATLVPKIWLNNDAYQQIRAIRILERISKSKSPSRPLSLGIHSALNSCMHLTNSLYNPGDTFKCKPLGSMYLEAIDRAVGFWLTTIRGKELIDFIESGDEDFKSVSRSVAKNYVKSLFDAPTLRTNRPGRSAYMENYSNCATPHPDPLGAAFYEEAADTAFELIRRSALSN